MDLRLAELVLRALQAEDADFVVDGEEGSESVSGFRQATVMGIPDAHAAAIADRVPFLADGRIVKDLGQSTSHRILEAMEGVSGR